MMEIEVITIDSDSIYSLETHILKEEEREEGSESREVVGQDACTTEEVAPEEEDKELPEKTVPVPICMLNKVASAPANEEAAAATSDKEQSSALWAAAIGACDCRFNGGFVRSKTMPADGDCLFRAILHQCAPRSRQSTLPSDQEVLELRKQVVTYLRENKSLLLEFLAQEGFDESIRSVEEGEWGDSMALYAVSNLWSVKVEVYMELGPLIVYTPRDEDAVAPRPLRLAYRCADDSGALVYNHYDSVLEVELDVPPSPPPPQCTAARRSTSTLTQRRSPRSHPRGNLRSPRPRAKRARADPGPGPGPAGLSQELMDRASPTPGVLAPGSPNTGEASASHEASQETSQRGFHETLEGSAEARLAAEISSIPQEETPPSPSCPSKAPSLGECGLPTTRKLPGIILPLQPISSRERTSQWLEKCPLALEEDADCDFEAEDDFHLYLPDLHSSHNEEVEPNDSNDTLCFMKDMETQFSSVCGTIVQCICIRGPSRPYITSSTGLESCVSESTNVVLSNGKLVGTCQSIY